MAEHQIAHYDDTGLIETESAEAEDVPQRPLFVRLMEEDPARADAVIALADGLVSNADTMLEKYLLISPSNTAQDFAQFVTDKVLTAALTLVSEEEEDPA